MQRYLITVSDKDQDWYSCWTMTFMADDFAHAEEQAIQYLGQKDFILKIELAPREDD
jgi:hypothetical protein